MCPSPKASFGYVENLSYAFILVIKRKTVLRNRYIISLIIIHLELPPICPNKSSCSGLHKNRVIVLDASALLNIVQAIVESLKSAAPTGFLYSMNIFLTYLSSCSHDGRIHVTRELMGDWKDIDNKVHEG